MNIKISPKKLFLIDGLGALVSALLIGVVLTKIHEHIGLPLPVLQFLAIPPVAFAVYSFNYFLNVPSNWQLYLKIIATVNIAYCLLTSLVMFHYKESLTTLGLGYFVTEIMVVLILVAVEIQKASQKHN